MGTETSGQSQTSTTGVPSGTFNDPHVVVLTIGSDGFVEPEDHEEVWATFKVGDFVRFFSEFGTVSVEFKLKQGGEFPFGSSAKNIQGDLPYELQSANIKWIGECEIRASG